MSVIESRFHFTLIHEVFESRIESFPSFGIFVVELFVVVLGVPHPDFAFLDYQQLWWYVASAKFEPGSATDGSRSVEINQLPAVGEAKEILRESARVSRERDAVSTFSPGA